MWRLFHRIVDIKSACFLLCAFTNFKLCDPCAGTGWGPVCGTFRSETVKQRRQLAGMYILYTCAKGPQKPQEHTSEHVKSQNAPRSPSHNL